MRKLTFLTAFLLAAAICLGQFKVGPRLGVNISTCNGKFSEWDDSKNKWIAGLQVGGTAEYGITDLISVNGEIYFIQSGSKCVSSYTDGKSSNSTEHTVVERYSNIEIPILVKATFGQEFQFFASAGPYFKFVLSGTMTMKEFDVKEKIDKDNYKSFDVGMYIGGGVQKQIGPGKVTFDARFGLGFMDTYEFSDGESKPNGYKPYKNRNISLTFAYMIPIGAQ